WSITIAAFENTGERTKALKEEGGFVVTHMGRVTKSDGATFSSDQLEEILNCLHYFLSFALGRWAGVALPIGLDAVGQKVYETWGMGKTAHGPWKGGHSWFDAHHADMLTHVFPGFMSLWKNNTWREPLTHAIYWYLAACNHGIGVGISVDAGLILTQTALELLAWTSCVIDRKLIPKSDFKRGKLTAAEKLRYLATSLDIPNDIPQALCNFKGPNGTKWRDSMHAITAVRNSLVHPDANAGLAEDSFLDAWKLSLWYLDMIFLRLCGHNGVYANRLAKRWIGEVESVPWVP
ncbi:MAG: hypothetical protein K8R36_13650, partial [Planctomycetales bacterium]|nr:hypothetical protein [Planctomycetales bacterium]